MGIRLIRLDYHRPQSTCGNDDDDDDDDDGLILTHDVAASQSPAMLVTSGFTLSSSSHGDSTSKVSLLCAL